MIHYPFFSIVVPSYNRAPFLSRTLTSILLQRFADFEVIVVDDGSTDNTAEVVHGWVLRDSRIHYIHQKNAERGAARNKGISAATGQFILFFDSDDEMKDDYLQKLFSGIQAQPSYNFYALKYTFQKNGREYSSSIDPFKDGPYGFETVLKGNPFACNFCIRRQNPSLRLFEEDRSLATTEDWMFLVENLFKDRIYVFDQVGMSMHEHDDRSMQQNALLIERRIRATQLLAQKLPFSKSDMDLLWAYTYYFCSIHAYLDNQRRQAIQFILKAKSMAGWNPLFLKAWAKYIVGRQMVVNVKALRAYGS